MRPRRVWIVLSVLLVAFAAQGCGCPRKLDGLDKDLKDLYRERSDALAAHQSPASAEAKLAGVASKAQEDAAACKDMAPAFYRIAAVSAWQSDGAGAALVNPITTQGIAACEALPAKDNSAPRDCTLIRIAAPMALQDELTVKQLALRKQAEQASNGKLPTAALSQLQQLLQGYSNASMQLATIRRGARGLSSPQALLDQIDRQRLIVYCNALETFGLIGKVEGMTFPGLAAERGPIDAIKSSMQGDGIDVSGPSTCASPPAQDAAFLTSP